MYDILLRQTKDSRCELLPLNPLMVRLRSPTEGPSYLISRDVLLRRKISRKFRKSPLGDLGAEEGTNKKTDPNPPVWTGLNEKIDI